MTLASRVVRIANRANREAPKSGDSGRIARRSIKSRIAKFVNSHPSSAVGTYNDMVMNFAAEMGSNPALYCEVLHTFFFGHKKLEMKFEMQMAVSNGQKAHHTISGNVLFQIRQILKTVVQKFQPANFVATPSVAAVLRGQQPTFLGILY